MIYFTIYVHLIFIFSYLYKYCKHLRTRIHDNLPLILTVSALIVNLIVNDFYLTYYPSHYFKLLLMTYEMEMVSFLQTTFFE